MLSRCLILFQRYLFDDRKRLTLQEVDHCIPVEPGTRAPWDILDALVRRDVAKVISAIDRAVAAQLFHWLSLRQNFQTL